MGKMKTRSAAKKRFTLVGKDKKKVKRSKAFRRHLLTKKTNKRKRQLRKGAYISTADEKRIVQLLRS